MSNYEQNDKPYFYTTPHLMVKSGLELTSGDLASIIIFTCPGDCKTENEEDSFVTEKATIVLYKKWIIQ